MNKPLVTLSSIKKQADLERVNRTIVKRGGEKLLKMQPKSVKKLG